MIVLSPAQLNEFYKQQSIQYIQDNIFKLTHIYYDQNNRTWKDWYSFLEHHLAQINVNWKYPYEKPI